jgi:hypothetical protein
MRHLLLLAMLAGSLAFLRPTGATPAGKTPIRFEVTVARGLLSSPQDGRVYVVLGRSARPEPRHVLGQVGQHISPYMGRDARGFAPGETVIVDQTAAIFPLSHLSQLSKGDYFVQAVFHHHRDLNLPGAPGNLVSAVKKVALDPAAGGVVKLELTSKLPADEPPADTDEIKFLKFRSERLSKFHGRPFYLRVGIILPVGHAKDTDTRYPLRVHIGGYGTRYTAVQGMMNPRSSFRRAWTAADAPRMILLHLDGAGPFGDPYQVNSANHGPYGDAILHELIPFVEKRFRGIGQGYARVLDGASTGGWVSLALQIFYPDDFTGAWSHAPDPVDFRAFELINIYTDTNAYVNNSGFERPAYRYLNGDVHYTVRHEVHSEMVLGRGDNWAISGKDWCAWNATFGPRGKDGLPVPLWDGKSGKIDRSVLDHWKKYDLRLQLETNWPTLAPKLAGKLRIWVGDADEYFLNNAVYLLDAFLSRAKPAHGGKITYGRRQGHGYRVLSERDMLREMANAIDKAKPRR